MESYGKLWKAMKAMEDFRRLWKVIESYGILWKVIECYGKLYPDTGHRFLGGCADNIIALACSRNM